MNATKQAIASLLYCVLRVATSRALPRLIISVKVTRVNRADFVSACVRIARPHYFTPFTIRRTLAECRTSVFVVFGFPAYVTLERMGKRNVCG